MQWSEEHLTLTLSNFKSLKLLMENPGAEKKTHYVVSGCLSIFILFFSLSRDSFGWHRTIIHWVNLPFWMKNVFCYACYFCLLNFDGCPHSKKNNNNNAFNLLKLQFRNWKSSFEHEKNCVRRCAAATFVMATKVATIFGRHSQLAENDE